MPADGVAEHSREPINVEQLARHVHWSPRHFSRAFQAQTGLSPAKAVEKLRLEAARALIDEGETSISRVATLTGFGEEETYAPSLPAHDGPASANLATRGARTQRRNKTMTHGIVVVERVYQEARRLRHAAGLLMRLLIRPAPTKRNKQSRQPE